MANWIEPSCLTAGMSLWPSRSAVSYSLPSERTPNKARINRPAATAPKTAPRRTESRRFLKKFKVISR